MNEDEYILLSDIHNYSLCPRRFALSTLENQSNQNWRTIDGQAMHKNAHSERIEKRNDMIIMRGLRVVSHKLCACGQCDVVEFYAANDGVALNGYKGKYIPFPVEYKRGIEPKNNCDKLQLCAQAICLEEMLLVSIKRGALFYGERRRRLDVEFDAELRDEVERTAESIHKLIKTQHTPRPIASEFCGQCSLLHECLPVLQKKKSVKDYISKYQEVGD